VDELLAQGRADEAQQVIDGVLVYPDELAREEVARSCGLLARLLALRGDGVRARLMAALAVELSRCCCATASYQAYAHLDRAYTLRTLGDAAEALACLRKAAALAPRHMAEW
jgi:tetratricopeptide (TPR) repeat protein